MSEVNIGTSAASPRSSLEVPQHMFALFSGASEKSNHFLRSISPLQSPKLPSSPSFKKEAASSGGNSSFCNVVNNSIDYDNTIHEEGNNDNDEDTSNNNGNNNSSSNNNTHPILQGLIINIQDRDSTDSLPDIKEYSFDGGYHEEFFHHMGGMDGINESQSNFSSTPTSSLSSSPSMNPSQPGSQAFVEHPLGEHPSRTLFVRNINSNIDDEELRSLFEGFGAIRSMYTQCKHRGFIMVSYYDIRHAKNAMKNLQNKIIRKRKLDIHYSIPKDNPSEKDQNQGTLVVFNLDPSITNEELKYIFGQYGEIKEIRETPNKKHHKFIEFYDVRDAERAMKHLNKTEIKGKKIKIEPSRPGGSRKNQGIPSWGSTSSTASTDALAASLFTTGNSAFSPGSRSPIYSMLDNMTGPPSPLVLSSTSPVPNSNNNVPHTLNNNLLSASNNFGHIANGNTSNASSSYGGSSHLNVGNSSSFGNPSQMAISSLRKSPALFPSPPHKEPISPFSPFGQQQTAGFGSVKSPFTSFSPTTWGYQQDKPSSLGNSSLLNNNTGSTTPTSTSLPYKLGSGSQSLNYYHSNYYLSSPSAQPQSGYMAALQQQQQQHHPHHQQQQQQHHPHQQQNAFNSTNGVHSPSSNMFPGFYEYQQHKQMFYENLQEKMLLRGTANNNFSNLMGNYSQGGKASTPQSAPSAFYSSVFNQQKPYDSRYSSSFENSNTAFRNQYPNSLNSNSSTGSNKYEEFSNFPMSISNNGNGNGNGGKTPNNREYDMYSAFNNVKISDTNTNGSMALHSANNDDNDIDDLNMFSLGSGSMPFGTKAPKMLDGNNNNGGMIFYSDERDLIAQGELLTDDLILNSAGGMASQILPTLRSRSRASSLEEKAKFVMDTSRVLDGSDKRTTLMIKNIPNKYTQKMLLAKVDEKFKGTYDFFYLPIDFKNKCNVGYAFINFIQPRTIVGFYHDFHAKKWDKFNSEKVCEIAYARIQGKLALISHFQNSSLMCEDKKCRPMIFHSEGPNIGEPEPFPVGPNVRPRMQVAPRGERRMTY